MEDWRCPIMLHNHFRVTSWIIICFYGEKIIMRNLLDYVVDTTIVIKNFFACVSFYHLSLLVDICLLTHTVQCTLPSAFFVVCLFVVVFFSFVKMFCFVVLFIFCHNLNGRILFVSLCFLSNCFAKKNYCCVGSTFWVSPQKIANGVYRQIKKILFIHSKLNSNF